MRAVRYKGSTYSPPLKLNKSFGRAEKFSTDPCLTLMQHATPRVNQKRKCIVMHLGIHPGVIGMSSDYLILINEILKTSSMRMKACISANFGPTY